MADQHIIFSKDQIRTFTKTFTMYNTVIIGLPFIIMWGSEMFEQVKGIVNLLLTDGVLAYLWEFTKMYFWIMLGLLSGIILHELIHALTFLLITGKGLKAVEFGFIEKPLIPYVHFKEQISVRAYRIGTAMPGILLGIIPSIAGLWSGSGYFLLFGIVFISAAAGDFLVIRATKGIDPRLKVRDLPDEIGFEVVG